MKAIQLGTVAAALVAVSAWAQPMRVAVLDFEDQTGMKSEAALGGAVDPGALAAKGVFLLGQPLLKDNRFELIDRRDFLAQIERSRPTDEGKPTTARPSFLRAAQALNADVVLRGTLQSFSVGKQTVNLGGLTTDFARLSLRVGIEALDTRDGAVIAMADGSAQADVRQTDALKTTLGEEDVLNLMGQAIGAAVPQLQGALAKRAEAERNRQTVKVSIKTTADPALVELDGVLLGSTPIENLEVYQGDHVLTVGKPGHRDITKRILLDRDSKIEVPMLRTELSAEERKEVLEKMRLGVVIGEPALTILPLTGGDDAAQ